MIITKATLMVGDSPVVTYTLMELLGRSFLVDVEFHTGRTARTGRAAPYAGAEPWYAGAEPIFGGDGLGFGDWRAPRAESAGGTCSFTGRPCSGAGLNGECSALAALSSFFGTGRAASTSGRPSSL